MEMLERTTIPTIIPVGKNFMPGKGIKIRCMVAPGASRFTITLSCGKNVAVENDAALHVSFNLSANNATVASKRKGVWDRERVVQGVPFDHSESFEISLHCDRDYYKLVVNGNRYGEYPQHVPYDDITFVAVQGDVDVESIRFDSDGGFQFMIVQNYCKTQCPVIQQVSFDPTMVSLNVDGAREPRRALSWKVYAVYGTIALLILVTVVCVAFVPKYGSKHDYDFD